MRSAAASAERIGPPWVTARTAVCGCVGDLQEAGDDARAEVVVRLAVVPAVAPLEPAGEARGKARLDLGASEPRPGTDIDLHEGCIRDGGEPECGAENLGRLTRSPERARIGGRRT